MSRDERVKHETRFGPEGQVVGADVVVKFDVDATSILNDGIEVRLDFDEWRDVASSIHRECSAAAFEQPIEVTQARVREALANAVKRAAEASRNPASRRAAAATLHRLADMVLAGTVLGFEASWPLGGDESRILVTYQVKMPAYPEHVTLKLGEGVVRVERGER